nr:MAG TPA: hypothetical protein [Caudoviricetes sp.]
MRISSMSDWIFAAAFLILLGILEKHYEKD